MVTLLKEWTREEVWAVIHLLWAVIQLLWAQNMEPVSMDRQIVAVYGASVISIQQVQKWCCDLPYDQVIVTDRDKIGSLSHQSHLPFLDFRCLLCSECHILSFG
jgi:hypothetical protein